MLEPIDRGVDRLEVEQPVHAPHRSVRVADAAG
jgi:hypothetical protein